MNTTKPLSLSSQRINHFWEIVFDHNEKFYMQFWKDLFVQKGFVVTPDAKYPMAWFDAKSQYFNLRVECRPWNCTGIKVYKVDPITNEREWRPFRKFITDKGFNRYFTQQ